MIKNATAVTRQLTSIKTITRKSILINPGQMKTQGITIGNVGTSI